MRGINLDALDEGAEERFLLHDRTLAEERSEIIHIGLDDRACPAVLFWLRGCYSIKSMRFPFQVVNLTFQLFDTGSEIVHFQLALSKAS